MNPSRQGVHPEIEVHARAAARRRASHPWIFRDDVIGPVRAPAGALVRVRVAGGRPLGYALYSARSKIALRFVTEDDRPPDDAFWEERVDRALLHRAAVVEGTDACRLLFGESDGIPGLVVDRYAEHLVVQCLVPAAEQLLPLVVAAVGRRLAVASVLARNDASVRSLEGLPREVRQVQGTTPADIAVREDLVRFAVDPWHGQKTGAYLDQRENRRAVAGYGVGRVLDVFCYEGAFALHAAARGRAVVAVDSSSRALERARANARQNELSAIEFVEANAFDELRRREREGERFGLVVLDPPAFAKSRADLPAALRAYKEINLRAMRLLEPQGMLVTSSCSYNLSEEGLLTTLAAAAADARKTFRVVEKRTQSRDHPIRLGFPESHYLKCLVLTVL